MPTINPTEKGTVLVTGATGFIAAQTVSSFLEAGYAVRGTMRSLRSTAAKSLAAALSSSIESGRLELVEVSDITAPGAFDTALEGVTDVAHLAMPVSFDETNIEYVMSAAVEGTLSILESAQRKGAQVRSFVYMSTIGTIRNFAVARTYTEADWNHVPEELVEKKGVEAGALMIYTASKVRAEKALWKWMEEKKPPFSVSALHPVWVAGPPLFLPPSPDQISVTNIFIWQVFSGQEYPPGPTGYESHVDVRDVARMTVCCVEHPEQVNGQRYIVAGNNHGHPQAVADVLRKAYPERRNIIKEGKPGEGYMPGYRVFPGGNNMVSDKAAKLTGQSWIPYDKMVLDAAKSFEMFL